MDKKNKEIFPLQIVGIDWLSISYLVDVENIKNFEILQTDRQTPIFKKHLYLVIDNMKVAELTYEPRLSNLNKKMAILRVLNDVLYSNDFVGVVKHFERNSGVKFISYNRIDFFTDFTKMKENYSVMQFFEDINKNKIRKTGKGTLNVVLGSFDINRIDTLSFGRYSSRLSFKIYNKTKEMKAKIFKNWIFENWQQAGLTKLDTVYRFEFSLKRKDLQIINEVDGDINEIDIHKLYDKKYIHEVFKSLLSRYFVFKKVDEKKSKEYWKIVNVINQNINGKDILCLFSRNKKFSNRADKIFLRKLISIYKSIQEVDMQNQYYIVMQDFVEKKDLQDYYNEIFDFI